MNAASLLLIIAAATTAPTKAEWLDYPNAGPVTMGYHEAGRTGTFRHFSTETKDRPEKVVLWYAKQLKIKDDHPLVKAAEAGYQKLKNPHQLGLGVGVDTDAEKWGAIIQARLSAESAYINLFVRPENDPAKDISISITQSPAGTVIIVIESTEHK